MKKEASCLLSVVILLKYGLDIVIFYVFGVLVNRNTASPIGFVTTDSADWGLWSWCYKDEVFQNFTSNSITVPECYEILPGHSPAYYEAVRCFTVVSYIIPVLNVMSMFFLRFDHPRDWSMILRAAPELLITFSALTTVAVLGAYYEDDPRWKDAHPSLEPIFWVIGAVLVLHVPLSIFVFCFLLPGTQMKQALCRVRQRKLSRSNASSVPEAKSIPSLKSLCTKLLRAFSIAVRCLCFASVEKNGQTDHPSSDNPPMNGGGQTGRIRHHSTNNEDCLHIQQNIQQEQSVMDSSSPGVHCTLVNFHCELDPPTGRLIFQLARPEQVRTDPDVSSYV